MKIHIHELIILQKELFFVYFFYWTGGTGLFGNDIEII